MLDRLRILMYAYGIVKLSERSEGNEMFINTKVEAKLAEQIAHECGFTRLTAEDFHKRYSVNVFSPWSSDSDAREAQQQIAAAVRAHRAAKRNPRYAERVQEAKAERERVAGDISSRTGEPIARVLKRLPLIVR
jgi:hypothetical protein